MRKFLRVITGIFFVGTVLYAYSTTIYVVTYYHQAVSDPDLRAPIFSSLALAVFIAAVVLACKLKSKTLWGLTGCAVLVSLGLTFAFGTEIQKHKELQLCRPSINETKKGFQ